MAKTFEQSKDEVARLVKLFETNKDAYHEAGYKEAHARQEFIDPLFIALGWDVHNDGGSAPDYREVVIEDSVEIEGHKKAPDYVFRVGRDRKFFVEAKKPGVDIKNDQLPAYQLRRYAWSAKLPLSLLTDFEELAVYDCRFRPSEKDKASTARINYILYNEYPDRWKEVYDLFSREAVWGGAYDVFTRDSKKGRGISEVDSEFLKEIEGWRDSLAKNIAIRNESLSIDQLNNTVQKTIDRIIFLRMAEDRKIEPYGTLETIAGKDNIYPALLNLFGKADARYNSGLFDFSKNGDKITKSIVIDDKTLKPILSGLYYPRCPYEFSMLAAETLGNVYEQFLGKVIRLTDSHHAKVEEKPEVKKAGGVYYTPAYIVDYIVKNTVGEAIKDKDPKQLKGFRVLDMACGSGSFLLGAYQYLLEYYLSWYVKNKPEKHEREVLERGGIYRLTTAERKRILTEHIFGVDIDSQAVEVTKLSLLLKVLEGESDESIEKQMQLFHERVLPSLENNIKCGNSLIGTDYFSGKLIPDEDDLKRVNPFDWSREFPDAMSAGGFDCVIGNPPYIRIQTMKEWAPLEVEIYKELYKSAGSGNYDIYVVFIEKALSLLNKNGGMGFILPHKFFNAQYGAPVRGVISSGQHLRHIVHFGDAQIFSGATTYTCLLFLDKQKTIACRFVKVSDLDSWADDNIHPELIETKKGTESCIAGTIAADKIGASEWNFNVGNGSSLFDKLRAMPVKLGDVADIFVGLQTSADDVYIMSLVEETPKTYRLYSVSLSKEYTFEKDLMFPIVSGTDVTRYTPLPSRQYILFPYYVENEIPTLITFDKINNYPKVKSYLIENKTVLGARERGKFNDAQWYRFGRSQNLGIQNKIKLCVPRLVEYLYASFDFDGSHFLDNVDVGGVTLKTSYISHDLRYLLALINSSVLRWYFPFVSAPFRGGWMSANRQFLSQIPIRTIDFNNPADKAKHDRMGALVDQMLDLHKKKAIAKDDEETERIERLIASTDADIDKLVYDLYGLTEEEIKIVEGKNE